MRPQRSSSNGNNNSNPRSSRAMRPIEMPVAHSKVWLHLPTLNDLVVNPSSVRRVVWVLTGIALMCVDAVELSVTPFEVGELLFFEVLRIISLFFWTLDVCFSFVTGVVIDNRIEMRPKSIAQHYMKGWFTFDF